MAAIASVATLFLLPPTVLVGRVLALAMTVTRGCCMSIVAISEVLLHVL